MTDDSPLGHNYSTGTSSKPVATTTQQQQQPQEQPPQKYKYCKTNQKVLFIRGMVLPVWKRAALVPFLLLALWILTDNETSSLVELETITTGTGSGTDTTHYSYGQHRHNHHLAVVTALQRHPPSLRVYQSLLEINLLLWGVVVSLWLWKHTIGNKMIGHLLFQPAEFTLWNEKSKSTATLHTSNNTALADDQDPRQTGDYLPVDDQDVTPLEVEDILLLGKKPDTGTSTSSGGGVEETKEDPPETDEDEEGTGTSTLLKKPQHQHLATTATATATTTTSFPMDHMVLPVGGRNHNNDPLMIRSTTILRDSHDLWDAHYDSDGELSSQDSALRIPLWEVDPPTPESVAAVAVDSLVLILVSLFLFTLSSAEGGKYIDDADGATGSMIQRVGLFRWLALIAAPLFPLLLFLGGALALIFPWKKRHDFWKILCMTMGAPFHTVTFRDGFLGDILTSSVRPLQDIAFTIFYILSGLQGWWKQSYSLDKADMPLETNWILHTFLLPMCMVSPLWWRFLQNLRQAYDHQQRWPYLGNALKYFLAAQVAMIGLFHPSCKQTWWWLSSFVIATLYQIWWDVFMDWHLLRVVHVPTHSSAKFSPLGSIFPYRLELRETRIYSVSWIYWTILAINLVLRFCWTLSFIPANYVNQAGVLTNQFGPKASSILLNPTIASAELVRRTLWGLLRVEWEAIHVGRQEPRLKGAWSDPSQKHVEVVELQPMDVGVGGIMEPMDIMDSSEPNKERYLPKFGWIANDMYQMNQTQILGELCFYAAVFSVLGILEGSHRVTL